MANKSNRLRLIGDESNDSYFFKAINVLSILFALSTTVFLLEYLEFF